MTHSKKNLFGRPQITFSDNTSTPLEMELYHMKVQVTLPIAKVTSLLTFTNNHNTTLAGELVFPLPDDASVIGYAMDVNGTLVDAVPIEKEKAKVVFEQEVRSHGKGVALVEVAAQSNSFKTKIYPLKPKVPRIVQITYQVPVSTVDNLSQVVLPFSTPSSDVNVSAQIEWHQQPENNLHVELVREGNRSKLERSVQQKDQYSTISVEKTDMDTKVDALVISSTQVLADNQVTVEGRYFCARMKIEQPAQTEKKIQPEKIQILYDASYSRRAQKTRDAELLEAILKNVQPKNVVFTTFSIDVQESVSCTSVKEFLEHFNKVIYDGATNLSNLETQLDESADYCVVITDGIQTIGKDITPETVYAIPLYIISTTSATNQHLLSHIATKSGGVFLNANSLTNEQISAKVGAPILYFLVADYESEQFEEVYPNEPVPLESGGFLHLYGKIKQGGEIAVMFKYGRDDYDSRVLHIEPSHDNQQKDRIVPYLWAKQKLNSMNAFPQLFDKEIKELAHEWKIVTSNTSLIVLETLEQYLKHDITPPNTLAQVYKEFMNAKDQQKQQENNAKENKIRHVLQQWNQRKIWHQTDFVEKIRQKIEEQERKKREEEERRKREEEERKSNRNVVGGDEVNTIELAKSKRKEKRKNDCIDEEEEDEEEMVNSQISCMDMIESGDSLERHVESRQAPLLRSSRNFRSESSHRTPSSHLSDAMPRSSERPPPPSSPSSSASPVPQSQQQDQLIPSAQHNETASIQVQKWNSDAPYMSTIKSASNPYEKYLELRTTLSTSPGFFLDVADYWLVDLKQSNKGINILTNILELELESEQLLRIVGYRLDQEKRYELAEIIFEQVKKIRPDEPQSYRDLALIKEKLGKLEEAADLLNQVIYKTWDERFDEIELTAAIELNHVLQKNPALPVCHEDFRYKMDLDLRISMAWDTNDTDVDLHVNEEVPFGGHVYFATKQSEIGGLISRDFRQGYGPEEYMLKVAPKGNYKISCNYYANHQQSLTGGTTILLTFFTNYMRPQEKAETVTVRLVTTASQLPVCTVTV